MKQPTQQPEDQVGRVAEAIDQWIGDISTSREMARAAIAAMPTTTSAGYCEQKEPSK